MLHSGISSRGRQFCCTILSFALVLALASAKIGSSTSDARCRLNANGNLVVKSQEDVEASAGCTVVPGAIWMSGAITDLSPLSNVTSVGLSAYNDSLWIHDLPQLKSLKGLDGLKVALPGSIWIHDCDSLSSLEGLEGIPAVGRGMYGESFHIEGNPKLRSFRGLAGLQGKLPGSLKVQHCVELQSMDGFERVTSFGLENAGFSLWIWGNPKLQSFLGLSGLHGELPGAVVVADSAALVSLDGLGSIKKVGATIDGYSIAIKGNPLIRSLAGLGGLQGALPGAITIEHCDTLESVSGLEKISMVGQDSRGNSLFLNGNYALRSLEGFRGLKGKLPGQIFLQYCHALTSFNGLQGIAALGNADSGNSLTVSNNAVLKSFIGLQGLEEISGTLTVMNCPELQSLAGLEGLTLAGGVRNSINGHTIIISGCPALESLAGLRSLNGSLSGGVWLQFTGPQSLDGFLQHITDIGGSLAVRLTRPVCFQPSVLERLHSLEAEEIDISIAEGSPAWCKSCSESCGTYDGHHIGCDVLRGGRCMCPLGRAGPNCEQKMPTVQAEISAGYSLRVQRPQYGAPPRNVAVALPLNRTHPTGGTTAVRVVDMAGDGDSWTRGYRLVPPFDDILWDTIDSTRGRIMVNLEIWGIKPGFNITLKVALAYHEGTSQDLYPDHVIDGTVRQGINLWSLRWPECKFDGACVAQSNQVLMVHFEDYSKCEANMHTSNRECVPDALCNSSEPPRTRSRDTPHQTLCECSMGHALKDTCIADASFWSVPNGSSPLRCPLYTNGQSTCLGASVCAAGYSGALCAQCEVGRVQQQSTCIDCVTEGYLWSLVLAIVFFVVAILSPHVTHYLKIPGRSRGVETSELYENQMSAQLPGTCTSMGCLKTWLPSTFQITVLPRLPSIQACTGCSSKLVQGIDTCFSRLCLEVWLRLPDFLQLLRPKMRMLLQTGQVLSVWPTAYYLKYPQVMRYMIHFHEFIKSFANMLSVFASILPTTTSLQCVTGVSVLGEFAIFMVAPVAFVALAALSASAPHIRDICTDRRRVSVNGRQGKIVRGASPDSQTHVVVQWSDPHLKPANVAVIEIEFVDSAAEVRNSVIWISFWISFLLYPFVSSLIILHLPLKDVAFHCVESLGCYFRKDYRLEYESDEYVSFIPWVSLATLVYPIGVPVAYFAVLCSLSKSYKGAKMGNEKSLLEEEKPQGEVSPPFTVLYMDFKPQSWYTRSFEVINMLRQFFINAATLLFPGGAVAHLYLSFLIMAIYMLLLVFLQPYREWEDNLMQMLCSVSLLIFFTAHLAALKSIDPVTIYDSDAHQDWVEQILEISLKITFVGLAALSVVIAMYQNSSTIRRKKAASHAVSRGWQDVLPEDKQWTELYFMNCGFLSIREAKGGLSIRQMLITAIEKIRWEVAQEEEEEEYKKELRNDAEDLWQKYEIGQCGWDEPYSSFRVTVRSKSGPCTEEEGKKVKGSMERLLRQGLHRPGTPKKKLKPCKLVPIGAAFSAASDDLDPEQESSHDVAGQ